MRNHRSREVPKSDRIMRSIVVLRKFFFPDDLAPVDKDYESPHVDLSQTTCSTPSNTITTSLKDGSNYTMNDVLDFVNSKLNEVMDAQ